MSIRRRQFLQIAGASLAATGSLTVPGCVATTGGAMADLIWGSYGFSEGKFIKPRAISIDEDDQLYIVDTTGRIQVFDRDGQYLRHWKTPDTENGRPTGMGFCSARQDPGGQPKLLVADTHYYRVLVYDLQGRRIDRQTIGGQSGGGPGQFAFLTDVAVDDDGFRYVGEYNASDRIQKFDPDGRFVCSWGGTGYEPGQFLRPQSLMVLDQTLYIADACNHRIQRFDIRPDVPRLIDVWSEPGSDPGQVFYPYGLDRLPDGSIVVLEYRNNRLQRFDANGHSLGLLGSAGYGPGQLNNPWGVVVDSRGMLHVLDSNNHRVQRFEPNFAIT